MIQVSMRCSGLVDALDEIADAIKGRAAGDGDEAVFLLLMEARTEVAKLARASHILALKGMKAPRS